jgi:hypothetical protein
MNAYLYEFIRSVESLTLPGCRKIIPKTPQFRRNFQHSWSSSQCLVSCVIHFCDEYNANAFTCCECIVYVCPSVCFHSTKRRNSVVKCVGAPEICSVKKASWFSTRLETVNKWKVTGTQGPKALRQWICHIVYKILRPKITVTVRDFEFSQHCCWRVSSGMLCRVDW